MTLYAISYGGSYALYQAQNEDAALLAAARDHFSIREATQDDEDWHRAMTGPLVPVDQIPIPEPLDYSQEEPA